MPHDMTVRTSATLNGSSPSTTVTVSGDVLVSPKKSGSSALAAAKTGSLTTRTDANTGTLTMTAGHGITTGAFLFLFWVNADGTLGSRRTIVGTVSVNSVPIDLGAGDDLPIATTAVTAFVAISETVSVVGDDVVGIRVSSTRKGAVQLTDGSDAEHVAFDLDADNNHTYIWWSTSGVTNPIAGDTVAKVKFGNGDSGGTNAVTVDFLYN
jgi:hypothetical protein